MALFPLLFSLARSFFMPRVDLMAEILALRQQLAILNRTTKRGCVAKNKLGYKNTELHFSSCGNLEEALHESNLPADVAFHDSLDLSLPNHVHGLIPSDGPPRRVETEEAESGIDSALYESVILLDYVIEVSVVGQSQVRTNSFL